MALTIYGIARTRTSRVLWMAEELGLTYTHVQTTISEEGTRSDAFRALNPNGRVPTIEDDGLVLFESFAITLHLAKRYGGPLAPRDLAEDGLMTMWTIWAATEFEPQAHEVLVHTINLPPERRDLTALESARQALARPLGALDKALQQGGGYLVGGRFSVADLNVACVAFYLRGAPDLIEAYPAISAWYAAATERPGYHAMMRLREMPA